MGINMILMELGGSGYDFSACIVVAEEYRKNRTIYTM